MPDLAPTSRVHLPRLPSASALRGARGWDSAGVVQAKHDLGRIAVRPPSAGRGRQEKLPHGLRTGIERLSGIAMDDVTVHTDSPEPARYRALAYARGSEIHVAPGQERHLAHEAWHVVQQKQRRVRPTLRTLGAPINDDRALEAEAHTMGERALRAASSTPAAGPAAGPGAAAQPGWSVSAPAQLLVGQTRFNWGIWARGGGSVSNNEHLADIHDALGRYHPERAATETQQAFADRRAKALDDAQRGAHRYLGAMGDLQQGGMPRDYMLGMLDDLQQEHVQHTDYVHRNNLNLWTGERLNRAERQQLQADWNTVRGGAGAVRLPGGAGNEADNRTTRASFARLMSQRHGRTLVHQILEQPAGPGAQPYRVDVQYSNRLGEDEQRRREQNRRDYAPLNAAASAALVRAQQNPSPANLAASDAAREATMPFLDMTRAGFRNMAADEPAAASRADHGANLRILRGMRDSENLNHSRANRGLIAASSHIILGHELVHALHYKRGQVPRGNPRNYEYGTPQHHWGNPEEHATIERGPGVTENKLRREHDMPRRVGHTSKRRAELDREETSRRRRAAAPYMAAAATVAGGYIASRYM